MPSRYFTKWLPYAEGVWEVAPKIFENSMHDRWGGKKNSNICPKSSLAESHGREIVLREYLKKLFRNHVRYIGSAPRHPRDFL